MRAVVRYVDNLAMYLAKYHGYFSQNCVYSVKNRRPSLFLTIHTSSILPEGKRLGPRSVPDQICIPFLSQNVLIHTATLLDVRLLLEVGLACTTTIGFIDDLFLALIFNFRRGPLRCGGAYSGTVVSPSRFKLRPDILRHNQGRIVFWATFMATSMGVYKT